MSTDAVHDGAARPSGPGGTHLPSLDGVRGLAILLVMWVHFAPEAVPGLAYGPAGRRAVHHLLNAGWAGVDLFFVLSGFLITGILVDAKGTDGYFLNFYARRTLRIFPLYYLALAVVPALLIVLGYEPHARAFYRAQGWLWLYGSNVYLAQHGLSFAFGPVSFSHFWTLAVEEQFYLVWPAAVAVLGRRQLRRACLALIVMALALRSYFALYCDNPVAAFVLTPCRADAFAIGALIALAAREGGRRVGWPTPARRRAGARAGAWMVAGGAVLLPVSFVNEYAIQTAGRGVLAVLAGGVILLALYAPRVGRALAVRPLLVLGKYSYGLYVVHFLLLGVCDRAFPLARFGTLGHVAASIALSLAAAWAAYHGVEKHFLRLKVYFAYGQPAARGATALA